jgi:MFS family permease
MLFGWQDLWDSVPGIFLAVPYGALADKYGRRWILTLGLAGAECTMLWIIFVCMVSSIEISSSWTSL